MNELNWIEISKEKGLQEHFIEENLDKVSWSYISHYQTLSFSFIVKHWNHIRFLDLKKNMAICLTEKEWDILLQKEQEDLKEALSKQEETDWDFISQGFYLEEDFLRKHINELDLEKICIYQILSEEFMYDFKDILNWHRICLFQDLSESFIEKTIDYVRWSCISGYQALSYDFMIKHIHRISILDLYVNKKLTISKKQIDQLHEMRMGISESKTAI